VLSYSCLGIKLCVPPAFVGTPAQVESSTTEKDEDILVIYYQINHLLALSHQGLFGSILEMLTYLGSDE